MSSVMLTKIALQAAEYKRTYVAEWRLVETYLGNRHIVGRFSDTGRYWATPPIVRLDSIISRAIARDGRQFTLIGDPGPAAAAASFIALCAAFDERLLTTRDITMELPLCPS